MNRNGVTIQDGHGTGRAAEVDHDGRLRVAIDLDDEFKQDLKRLIHEIINEIAEGQLLGTGANNE